MEDLEGWVSVPLKFRGRVVGFYNVGNVFSGWGNSLSLPFHPFGFDEFVDYALLAVGDKIIDLIKCLGYVVEVDQGKNDNFFIRGLGKCKSVGDLSASDILEVIKGDKCFRCKKCNEGSYVELDIDEDEDFGDDVGFIGSYGDEVCDEIVSAWGSLSEGESDEIVVEFFDDEDLDIDVREEGEMVSLPREINLFFSLLAEEGLEIDDDLFITLLERAFGVLVYNEIKGKGLERIAEVISGEKFDIVEEIKVGGRLISVIYDLLSRKTDKDNPQNEE